MWMTSRTGGIWKKSVSWELNSEREGSTFGARWGQTNLCAKGVTRVGVGADGKASIERLYISLHVETFNSKVIKGFVPEVRSRYVFFVFRDSYVLCIYVMNILCTFQISVSGYGTSITSITFSLKYIFLRVHFSLEYNKKKSNSSILPAYHRVSGSGVRGFMKLIISKNMLHPDCNVIVSCRIIKLKKKQVTLLFRYEKVLIQPDTFLAVRRNHEERGRPCKGLRTYLACSFKEAPPTNLTDSYQRLTQFLSSGFKTPHTP